MAIVKMKRLRLLAMREDREELLRALQRLGCVEIDEPALLQDSEGGEAPGAQGRQALLDRLGAGQSLSPPEGGGLWEAQNRRQEAERAMAVLKAHGAKGRGFLSPRPRLTEAELLSPQAAEGGRQAVERVLSADRELARLQGERTRLQTQRAALAPWLTLEVPLESGPTRDVFLQLGTLSAALPLEEAQRAAEGASELVQLTQVSADRESRYCLLVCHASARDGVLEALRDFGWSRAALSGWTGTAGENDRRLAGELAETEAAMEKVQADLAALTGLEEELCRAWDRASIAVRREEGRARLLDTEQTFLLEGWAPADSWPRVEQALSRYPCAWEADDPSPEDYPQVPVELKNNWLTRPLNMVTSMYSLPAYGTVDPNPLMAPFFILFYGIMMADMGYGLLMMLASVVVLRRARPKAGMHDFFALLGLCGVSTFLMGAVTGGFFGDFIPQLLRIFDPESTFQLPALFTPLNDTLQILVGAMALGFVQIVTGMAISFVQKLRHGQVLDAVFEEVTWWLVFAGLALALLGVTPLVLYGGGALVLAGPLVTGKGLGKITGIFGSLYNHITGYFGDILSYSRLMALMLAGSVIAQVFNTLGAIPGNVVIFIFISLVGNALNFALNLLGCYVHDLRLQCLEYFNKFYQDGGKPFRPMGLDTKYVDLT